MSYGIQIPPGLSRDDALLLLVQSRLQACDSDARGFLSNLTGWYDDYRGIYRGKVASFRNNVALPLAYAMVWASVAKQVQALYLQEPYVAFQATAPEWNGIADRTSRLVSAQLRDSRAIEKAVDFHSGAAIYGTAVYRTGWSYIQRLRHVKEILLGQVITRPQSVVEFNGPDHNVVDLLDFRIAPGFKFIQDAPYIFFRYYLDLDDIEESNQGEYKLYRDEAIAELKRIGMPTGVANSMEERQSHSRSQSDYEARRRTIFSKPVEIWEMHGLVPREFAPDGVRTRCVVMANGRVILRNDPSPYYGHPAVALSPTPDPHSFYGIGKVQAVSKLQAAGNRILNQKLDTVDLALSPIFIGDAGRLPNVDNLLTKPGSIFLTDGPPREVIEPVQMNFQGLQAAYMELDSIWKYMQMAGATDENTIMGMPGSDRQTAYEFRGRQEQAMTRIALEAMLGSCALERLAEQYRDLNRDLLPMPAMVKILGTRATTNLTTGLPLPPESELIVAGELDHSFAAKAYGPLLMLTRAGQRQDAMMLLQQFTANPVLMQATNWVNFARKLYSYFDGWDSNEMLVNTVPAINTLGAQTGMSPEDLVNASMDPSSAMAGGTPGINSNPNTEAEYGQEAS